MAAVENHSYALCTLLARGGVARGGPLTRLCTLEVTGSTALHTASANGFVDQVRVLLVYGHTVDALTNQNETPLYAACRWGEGVAAGILLRAGADVNARTANATTPFHAAISHGFLDLAAYLYAKGARRMCNTQCTKCRLQLKMAAKRLERVQAKVHRQHLADPTPAAVRGGAAGFEDLDYPEFLSTLQTAERESTAETSRRRGQAEAEVRTPAEVAEAQGDGDDWVPTFTTTPRTSDEGAKKKATKKKQKKKK